MRGADARSLTRLRSLSARSWGMTWETRPGVEVRIRERAERRKVWERATTW
ncbi:hypothetical protein ABZT04_30125 [Streptomyces sp. NPDC005492]|uniref:hypothetical protein n=1 Tax=Streptomyces sp. NPDC005492 TaxID=3156883 RepID=UPI0033B0C4D0